MNTEPDETQPKKSKFKGCGGCLSMLILGLMGFIAISHNAYNNSQNLYIMWCEGRLIKIGVALKEYAKDHDGNYPPLSIQQGQLMMPSGDMIPRYLDGKYVFICSTYNRDSIVNKAESFVADRYSYYISHVITTEAEGLVYVEAYKAAALAGNGFDHDFVSKDGKVIPRINTANVTALEASKIPIMIEKSRYHYKRKTNVVTMSLPAGKRDWGHVLYLDGHVELKQITPEFPMTTSFIEALESIDQ